MRAEGFIKVRDGDSVISALRKRVNAMERERDDWCPNWRELRKNLLPVRGRFPGETRQPKRESNIINSTPWDCIRIMSAGLQSGLTSPSNTWFLLSTIDPELAKYPPVKEYLSKCEEVLYGGFRKTGVYNTFQVTYQEYGAFGTGAFLQEEDYQTVFRTKPLTIGSYAIGLDAAEMPNSFCRSVMMTPDQMAERFGLDNVSDSVKSMYDNGSHELRNVNHLIIPNDGRIEGSAGTRGKPFLSFYFEDGASNDEVLSVGGFNEFPVLVGMWDIGEPNTYGYGPGDMALEDCKMLQKLERDKLIALELAIKPPIVASAEFNGNLNLLPNARNYAKASGADPYVKPIYQVQADIDRVGREILSVENRIKSAFFVQLFLMISQLDAQGQNPQKTATEIAELHQERLNIVGPVIERQETGVLKRFIDRSFAMYARAGLFPEPPEELIGQELKVEYVSPLALAQKMVKTSSMDRLAQAVGTFANISTDTLDLIDCDKAIETYAEFLGVPPGILRDKEIVQQIREQRSKAAAQQQQQAQQMEMAKIAPQAAKNLSETEIGPGSALGLMLGNRV